jgi:hypothetical protein
MTAHQVVVKLIANNSVFPTIGILLDKDFSGQVVSLNILYLALDLKDERLLRLPDGVPDTKVLSRLCLHAHSTAGKTLLACPTSQ